MERMHYGVWMVCLGRMKKKKKRKIFYESVQKQVKPSQKTGTWEKWKMEEKNKNEGSYKGESFGVVWING